MLRYLYCSFEDTGCLSCTCCNKPLNLLIERNIKSCICEQLFEICNFLAKVLCRSTVKRGLSYLVTSDSVKTHRRERYSDREEAERTIGPFVEMIVVVVVVVVVVVGTVFCACCAVPFPTHDQATTLVDLDGPGI